MTWSLHVQTKQFSMNLSNKHAIHAVDSCNLTRHDGPWPGLGLMEPTGDRNTVATIGSLCCLSLCGFVDLVLSFWRFAGPGIPFSLISLHHAQGQI